MNDKDFKELKEFLLNYFSKDFQLSSDTFNFFESQYGVKSAEHIKEIIEEDSSLIKLIAFPDKNFRELFYTHAPFCVDKEKVEEICLYLKKRINSIRCKVHGEILTLPLPDDFFCEFFLAIKWTVHIPDPILDIINELPSYMRFQILYKLKQANISWDENITSFFEMFFMKFQDREDIYVLIKNLLSLFTDKSNVEDIKLSLIKRIYKLRQMMSSYVATNNEIDKKGLEFVLTSKIPILDVDIEKLQREVVVLEEILTYMFPFSSF